MNLLKFFKAMLVSVPRTIPAECSARVSSGTALLIDVREPNEWTSGVAQGAALLPMSDLNGSRALWEPFLEKAAGRELLVYCAVGGRAGIVAKLLASEGFAVANAGGFPEWTSAGWPVVTPPAA
jgi:rhodanese-related sulfurtransferase